MSASKESNMNSRTNISLFSTIREIFQESFDCLPFVFKKTTVYFGYIWFPLAILIIILFHQSFPHSSGNNFISSSIHSMFSMSLHLIGHCFIIFLVPYFVLAFLNQKSNKPTLPMKDFISENMFPLVVNHIKTTFTILLFFLLLILPGIIKGFQLALVTQVTFFDDQYKNGNASALKISQKLTKGFLFGIAIITFIMTILPFILSPFYMVISLTNALPFALISVLKFLSTFYLNCFGLILLTQAYFVLKKRHNL